MLELTDESSFRISARISRRGSALLAWLFASQAGASAALQGGPGGPGPGIVQPTGIPAGTVVSVFDAGSLAEPDSLGGQPTMADFQHGWLYIVCGGFPSDGHAQRHNWFNLFDPADPSEHRTAQASGNKPHGIVFWDHYIVHGGNDRALKLYDYYTGAELRSHDTGVRSVNPGAQPPFEFRTTNGYVVDGNELAITRFDPDNPSGGIVTTEFGDLSAVGFKIGSSHPIGNLLVCSASQARGVATFDISDPTRPSLLCVRANVGNNIYTSMVYGSKLYACEPGRGIRVYDFSDPRNVHETGFLSLAGYNPRYVTIKDGKGYVASGVIRTPQPKLIEFDALAATPAITNRFSLDGASDFTFPLGNMVLVGGAKNSSVDATYTALISLGTARDTLGPRVEYANPADGAINLATTARIGFNMSEHIDVTSLTTSTFRVRPVCPPNAPAITGTYSVKHYGTINFAPDQPLLSNTVYEVDLPGRGIRDLVGNGLRQAYHATFTTGPGDVPPPAKTHHWRLDGNALDVVGTNPGTPSPSLHFSSGQVGQAAYFDGTASIDLGTLDLPPAFGVTAWVWIDSSSAGSRTILANRASGPGYRLFVDPGDGSVHFKTSTQSMVTDAVTEDGVLPTDGWHWVAVSCSGAAARIYVDGCDRTADPLVAGGFPTSGHTFLGQTANGTSRLEGRLDDVRTYGRALSAEEVAWLYGEGYAPQLTDFSTTDNIVPVGTSVTFTATATDNEPLRYSFSFGDGFGATPSSSSPSATHSYTAPGRFAVSVQVTDGKSVVSRSLIQIVHDPLTANEPSHSATIVHDATRAHVWNVNTDSDSVTCLDATTMIKLTEIEVADEPRFLALRPGNSEVWVSSARDPKVTVIDASSFAVLASISLPQGSRPAGVAFAPNGSAAFLVLEGSGGIVRYDPATRLPTAARPASPSTIRMRSVAVSSDSLRVYAPRFITRYVDGTTDAAEVYQTSALDLAFLGTTLLQFDDSPDTEDSGGGALNYLADITLSPDGKCAWIPAKKDNTRRGKEKNGLPLTFENTVRTTLAQLDLTATPVVEDEPARIDVNDHGFSVATVFSEVGDVVFAAFPLNREVLAFDAVTRNPISGVEVGLAPDGLALGADGLTLFVNEANERRVSKIDVGGLVNGTSDSMPLIASTTVTSEALPANIAGGKRIFFDAFDPRMSRDAYMSCASCHFEGDGDGRVWDFKDRGQGLRNTADLRGHGGTAQGRVHWTGNFDEIQDFELDIRGALTQGGFRTGLGGTGFIVDGVNGGKPWPPLGAPNQGRSRELDDLAAYVSSLAGTPPSPFRAADGQLTGDAMLGKASFESPGQDCASCHSTILFTDSPLGVLHDVGTGGSFDTPTLKGIWGTAPYLHDGRASTLESVFDALHAPAGTPHATVRSLSPRMQARLMAYLRQIDDRETDATHHWMLDGDATDSVGANHGTITGIAFRSGRFGQAGYFDGSDHIGLGMLDFGNAFTITCSTWIDATASGPQTLVANTLDGAAQSGFRLQVNTVDKTDGKVHFHTVNGNTNSASTATGAVTTSGWYSIAVTRDGSVCRIFVNGTDRTVDSSVHPFFSTNQGTRLGSTTNAAQRLVGRLDQVRVFDRVLSSHEIAMLASE